MKYYVGLDVSLRETAVYVVDEKGKIIKEKSVLSESDEIVKFLKGLNFTFELI